MEINIGGGGGGRGGVTQRRDCTPPELADVAAADDWLRYIKGEQARLIGRQPLSLTDRLATGLDLGKLCDKGPGGGGVVQQGARDMSGPKSSTLLRYSMLERLPLILMMTETLLKGHMCRAVRWKCSSGTTREGLETGDG